MNKFLRYLQHSWLSENVIKTLPMFISLNIAAVSIWQLGISDFAMPLMLGIIAGGLVDLDNSLIGRAKNLIISLVAFSLSSIGRVCRSIWAGCLCRWRWFAPFCW